MCNEGGKRRTEHAEAKARYRPKIKEYIQEQRKKSKVPTEFLIPPMDVNVAERMLYINKNGKPTKSDSQIQHGLPPIYRQAFAMRSSSNGKSQSQKHRGICSAPKS